MFKTFKIFNTAFSGITQIIIFEKKKLQSANLNFFLKKTSFVKCLFSSAL